MNRCLLRHGIHFGTSAGPASDMTPNSIAHHVCNQDSPFLEIRSGVSELTEYDNLLDYFALYSGATVACKRCACDAAKDSTFVVFMKCTC